VSRKIKRGGVGESVNWLNCVITYLFIIISSDGSILWQYFLPNLVPFSNNGKKFYLLYTQRTVAHFPLSAQCVVLGKSRSSGGTILHVFNPMNGKSLDETAPQGTLLPYKVVQAMLLPQIGKLRTVLNVLKL
jgi:hypothetical protein